MRSLVVLLAFTAPAHAWEFTAVPVCTLAHKTDSAEMVVTYDPRQAEPYSIAVATPMNWSSGTQFALRFDGPRAMTITTDRHVIDAQTLAVRDRGFGNVLNGLEHNTTATALFGKVVHVFPLEGIKPAMEAFRACLVTPVA